MSNVALSWAWDQSPKTPSQKLLLIKLADQANDDGVCWPSMRHLSKHTGISKSAISRAANELANQGLVRIKETLKHDGSRGVNVYHLSMPGVPKSEEGGVAPTQRGGVAPTQQGVPPGWDITQREPSKSESQNPGDAAASTAPKRIGQRRWRVPSPRREAGFIADLGSMRCGCENRSPTPCRHLKAAAVAEDKAAKVRARTLRDAVWDLLAEIYGEPAEAQRKLRGSQVMTVVELLSQTTAAPADPAEDAAEVAAAWSAEIRRRHAALAHEWGVPRTTIKAFVENFHLAGKVADGETAPSSLLDAMKDYE